MPNENQEEVQTLSQFVICCFQIKSHFLRFFSRKPNFAPASSANTDSSDALSDSWSPIFHGKDNGSFV